MSIDTIAAIGHKAEALDLIEVAQNAHHPESATAAATAALAHATLALVEQQRIANLIAYMAMPEEAGERESDAWPLITKGLGL